MPLFEGHPRKYRSRTRGGLAPLARRGRRAARIILDPPGSIFDLGGSLCDPRVVPQNTPLLSPATLPAASPGFIFDFVTTGTKPPTDSSQSFALRSGPCILARPVSFRFGARLGRMLQM